jgi:hypothetical protein
MTAVAESMTKEQIDKYRAKLQHRISLAKQKYEELNLEAARQLRFKAAYENALNDFEEILEL